VDMTDSRLAHPKPEPRKRVKARERRSFADHVKAVRDYVFGRERGTCRCCRARAAESMHELVFRSLGGKVSRKNSVAVCGDGVRGCHGLLQRHEVIHGAGVLGAESTLMFTPVTLRAADYMRINKNETIVSPPMRETEDGAAR
jgi:hypothetical protein